ncbi:MAG TPA: polyphenol oxidase family protein [Gemmatimonadales bacterium]|nr:polyphenol oxidase family protein [Gemmatimonadales bacterium]
MIAAGRRDSGTAGASTLTEEPVSGELPRLELARWRDELGLIAGITGRGREAGPGFDLGLWSVAPVGEVMRRWRLFRAAMSEFSTVVLGNQVHGTEVRSVGAYGGWIQVEGVDGWVTTSPGVLLTVTVADCIPVYLAVPGRGIALLHAGWRGTAGGIMARGVGALTAAVAADPSDIVMHCGIGICGQCYEVGSEVVAGCGRTPDGAGPWHLDLREVLADQASALGVGTVTCSTHCSAHERPTFYSHRASRGADGRMVAYLGIPEDGTHERVSIDSRGKPQ